jgi:glutamyl-tRNA reductase
VQLVIVGTHQRICPVGMREQLAFGAERMREALASLRQYADEGFIISTCNRVEVGGIVSGGPNDLERFLAEWHHMPPENMAPYLYTYTGADAARHVFRLGAGLDSMVLGEDQVMVQIKAALAQAQSAGAAGQRINRLLNGALATGKSVRTRTEIARSHLSTVSVALDIARQELCSLRQRNIVIVGAGRIAELALKHIHKEAPRSLVVLNRTYERASDLAASYAAQAMPIEYLQEALRRADVVLACTASPDTVIDAAMVERATGDRATPLVLLDLAVPRDIDPAAAAISGVRLIGIDDMRAICDTNRAARAGEVAAAEALVEAELGKFMEWWTSQEVVPTIRALRERAEAIRLAEIDRALARLPNLSERDQAAIHAMSAAIVNKLLHQPIATLKETATDGGLALAVQHLFQLQDLNGGS